MFAANTSSAGVGSARFSSAAPRRWAWGGGNPRRGGPRPSMLQVGNGSLGDNQVRVLRSLFGRDADLFRPVAVREALQAARPSLALLVGLARPTSPIDAEIPFARPARRGARIVHGRRRGPRCALRTVVHWPRAVLADPAITEQGPALRVLCARRAAAAPRRRRVAHRARRPTRRVCDERAFSSAEKRVALRVRQARPAQAIHAEVSEADRFRQLQDRISVRRQRSTPVAVPRIRVIAFAAITEPRFAVRVVSA